jgi:conjugative transfer signal peptidase TraF
VIGLDLSKRRAVTFYVAMIGAALVVASTADIWPLRLVYNASASVPKGFYAVCELEDPAVDDLVVARLPPSSEQLLVERGYIAPDVPVLKHVMARTGQRVCRVGNAVTIGDRPAATALDVDDVGRLLPRWSGCRVLGPGEVFLLNAAAPASFDGRYFGPVSIASIIGKATPLWTW